MSKSLRESEDTAVQKTLLSSYCPDLIREAREKQDEILVNRFQGGSYKIADIGCGDGYHGSTFGPSSKVYHGFEIAPAIADIARKRWREEGLDHAEVSVGDVTKATLQDEFYDLVFCLYFTAGNFRDQSKDLSLYTDQYLDRNPVFVALLSRLYKALKPGGSIFLTVYKDVPEAQAAQIDFYVHTGQHVVTPKGSRFVATAEGFWSARWTTESMLSNLAASGIDASQVTLNDLNSIAWLVEITK